MANYRRSTRLYLWLLGFWGVVGFSKPDIIPTAIIAGVGAALPVLVILSDFRPLRVQPIPIALGAMAIASPLWTGSGTTSWQSVFYASVTFSAIVFSSYVPLRQALRTLDLGFKAIVLITLVMLVIFPSSAFDDRYPNVGTLTGPYVHKNILGTMLVLGLLTSLYVRWWRNRPAEVVIWVSCYCALIAMTRSTTAYVLGALILVTAVLTHTWGGRSRQQRVVSITMVGVIGFVVVALLRPSFYLVLHTLDPDATFSGRTRIWTMTIEAWKLEPWLGYGWSVAYNEDNIAANFIQSLTGWYVPSSHSGYLSMLLQLGLVGAGLLVIFTIVQVSRAVGQVAERGDAEWRWVLLAMLVFATNNVFDSRLDSTAWFVAVLCAGWLSAVRFEARRQRAKPSLRSRRPGNHLAVTRR